MPSAGTRARSLNHSTPMKRRIVDPKKYRRLPHATFGDITLDFDEKEPRTKVSIKIIAENIATELAMPTKILIDAGSIVNTNGDNSSTNFLNV